MRRLRDSMRNAGAALSGVSRDWPYLVIMAIGALLAGGAVGPL